MLTRSSTRLLFPLLGLVLAVTVGLAGLSHLKFKSFLSESVNERLQTVAATSARDFAAAWGKSGVDADVVTAPGRDHFTVLNALAEPGHDVLAAANRLLGI